MMQAAGAMDGAADPFDKLPDEVYQLIFHAIGDCKSLVRCMAVSRAFRDHSERVSLLSIVCPGQFTSYVEKLQQIYVMVRRFHSLEDLVVRIGQPKDEPPSWARCMRFAEIGSSVEKFIFMAAKTGEFSDLDSALRGIQVVKKEKKESSSEGEGETSNRFRAAAAAAAAAEIQNQPSSSCSSNTAAAASAASAAASDEASFSSGENHSHQQMFLEFSLRQVVAPSNDVLKRMVPVIVFAIVQGLDEFRDSVPAFIYKFKKLRTFLMVDMLESVTVFMREHQIEQIRSRQEWEPVLKQESLAASEAVEAAGRSAEDDIAGREVMEAEDERSEMSRHDGATRSPAAEPVAIQGVFGGDQGVSDEADSSVRKGKALDVGEGSSGRKLKGKEVEVEEEVGESSSGISSLKNEDKDDEEEEDEEVTSPLRSEVVQARRYADVVRESGNQSGGSASPPLPPTLASADAWREAEVCESSEQCFPASGSEDNHRERADERSPSSDDGAETWRNSRGICIHGPGDSRGEFVSKYPFKRVIKGSRENRSMRIGACRRRERSADWLDESVRRRQENRVYKGMGFRRREESRAFKTWRLGKRERDESDDSGSYSAQSVLESSFPSCSSSPTSAGFAGAAADAGGQVGHEGGGDEASSAVCLDPLGDREVTSSRLVEERQAQFRFNQLETTTTTIEQEAEAEQSQTQVEQQQQQRSEEDRSSMNHRNLQQQHRSRLSQGSREAWRQAWRETWGERLGRRARELRREMQNEEIERQGARRERLREGVRKRQMEIERESLRFDITFWRAEEVAAANSYRLSDVSMCIATHSSKPLSVCEVERLAWSGLAGPLLAATIALVNEQACFHNL